MVPIGQLGASSSCTRLGKISEAREYWVEAKKLVASPSSLDPFLLHADAYITMCEGEHEDSREKYEASIRKFEELLTCKEFFADEENRDIQLEPRVGRQPIWRVQLQLACRHGFR